MMKDGFTCNQIFKFLKSASSTQIVYEASNSINTFGRSEIILIKDWPCLKFIIITINSMYLWLLDHQLTDFSQKLDSFYPLYIRHLWLVLEPGFQKYNAFFLIFFIWCMYVLLFSDILRFSWNHLLLNPKSISRWI